MSLPTQMLNCKENRRYYSENKEYCDIIYSMLDMVGWTVLVTCNGKTIAIGELVSVDNGSIEIKDAHKTFEIESHEGGLNVQSVGKRTIRLYKDL